MRLLVFIFQVTILFLILDGIVAPGTWRNRWNRLIHPGRENKKTETHATQAKPKINHQTAASTKTSSTTAAHKPVVPSPPAQARQASNSPPNTGTHSHTHTQGTPNNTTAQKPVPVPIENVPSVQVSPPHPVQKEPEQQPPHTPTDQQPPAEETKKDQHKQTNITPGETSEGPADKASEKHGHLSAIPAEKENKTGTEGGGEDADKKVEVGDQKVETPREGHKHIGEAHETEITGQADAPVHNTREHTGNAAAPLPVQEETGGHVPKPKTQTGAPAETPAEQHNGGAVSTNDKAPEVDAKAVEASGRK